MIETDNKTKKKTLSMLPFERVETEETGEVEDIVFFDDGDAGEDAILRAVMKKAGFVQAMFADLKKAVSWL